MNIRHDITQRLPPGPTASPWDQAQSWIERPIEFWTECHREFGDTFTVQFGSLGPTVLFSDPESIQQIFALPGTSFECQSFNDHYRVIMGAKSLLTLDGDEHWKQRRIVASVLHQINLSDWIDALRAQTQRQIQFLHDGQRFHVRRFVHEISFDIILHLLFGNQQSGIRSFLKQLFLNYLTKDYGTWSPWARFANSHQALRILLGAEIRRQRNDRVEPRSEVSLFNRLVHLENPNEVLPDAQIEDHIFTMLIAGVDPSAIATTWGIYWIHESSRVLTRLRDEVRSAKDLNEYIQAGNTFLHHVCLESLRMYPVVTTPSGRKLLKSIEVGGRRYPEGVTLLPCTYLAHRRENVFHRPHEFVPERFAERTYTASEFFPFGGGRRVCIGARLAPITMKAIIAELLRNLEMRASTEGAVVPIRHGTLLAPSDNFRLQIERRF